MNSRQFPGALPGPDGVHFDVWAPQAKIVEVVLEEAPAGTFALKKNAQGYFYGTSSQARPGSLYRYRIDGKGPYPDPASRYQPQGVHGPSQIIDPSAYEWSDSAWRGLDLKDLIFYELHVGAFSPQGTFAGVSERLHYLNDLGITAIELMPIADFAGSRNWGYDGVSLFAPSRAYGHPGDLRQLVDRAHQLGLAVILDVVYNHLGPDGNYLGTFSPFYFTPRHQTPWGSAVNLDGEQAEHARAFFIENARQWISDFHMDGLRLDATHAMMDDSARHFLAELSDCVRAAAPHRRIHLIAEDHRNLAKMVKPEKAGGWGMDAVWADDFHHQVRRSLAGDREGYFEDFSGSIEDLALTVEEGWFFQGQPAAHFGGPRGTDPKGIPLERFVVCIQNHDQVGNRARGERLSHQIDPASYRAASALLLAVPETPLLFMGQEWGARSPFLYFTDHHEDLGQLVTQGRREEFKSFSAFADPAARAAIPDPQALSTFERSHLQWSELDQPPPAHLRRLYQKVLSWRKKRVGGSGGSGSFKTRAVDGNSLWLEFSDAGQIQWAVAVQWKGAARHILEIDEKIPWSLVLTTEDSDVCEEPWPIAVRPQPSKLSIEFQRPGAAVFEWKRE